MGEKRPFPDDHPAASESRPTKQARKPFHKKPSSSSSSGGAPREGISRAKKRLRAINRLFQQDGDSIPDNARQDLEREVSALASTISDREWSARRSKMISKYHMIRFFERRKAERVLRRLQKQQEKGEEVKKEEIAERLRKDIHIAEVDLNYTQYHPHLESYTSLYPSGKKDGGKNKPSQKANNTGEGEDDGNEKSKKKGWGEPTSALQHLHAPRPHIWHEVEAAMEEGHGALERLRERRDAVSGSRTENRSKTTRSKMKGEERKVAAVKKESGWDKTSDSINNSINNSMQNTKCRRKTHLGGRNHHLPKSKNRPSKYVGESEDEQYSHYQQHGGESSDEGGFFEEY